MDGRRERWMGGREGVRERRQCLLESKHYLLIGSHSLLTGAWSIRDWRRQESYRRDEYKSVSQTQLPTGISRITTQCFITSELLN